MTDLAPPPLPPDEAEDAALAPHGYIWGTAGGGACADCRLPLRWVAASATRCLACARAAVAASATVQPSPKDPR